MKLSLKWLNEFVSIDDVSVEEICDKVVKAGFEVESVDKLASGNNLVVGQVIECENHPDSDHLHITKVDIGDEILDIVCGAPNCRKDLKVIVAKVGAELPEITIKKSKIRGVESNGMLCSLLELGVDKSLLPDNSTSLEGIEELCDDFKVGESNIIEKLGYNDTILDISIYANRPDCLSMFAMAKEMAAILDKECKLPDYLDKANIGEKSNFKLKSDTLNCPHFLAKVVNHVEIKESPKWISDYLRSNGIKSINNVIDISNIVMLETGQPLHFYDLRAIPNKEITVKDDYEGDYVALDGITYKIEKGDMMITSDSKPIGIAGIMGGDATKILDDTSSIVIEAALFNNAQIRRSANRLGLMTEAASRFSKGLEPLSRKKAVDRAVGLLIEYAGAKDFEETVEFGSDNYTPIQVKENLNHLNTLIGKNYSKEEVIDVLRRLDFNPEVKGDDIISNIPSYRTDIKIAEDIDEEITRLTNFDDLKSSLPLLPQTIGSLSKAQKLRRGIKAILMDNGLQEVITYTLVSKEELNDSLLKIGEPVELASPLSEARRYVRQSLLPSLINTLSYNLDHYNENVNLFEVSKVYSLDKEEERIGIILHGNLSESKIKKLENKNDFYVLKSLILDTFDKLGYEQGRIEIIENDIDIEKFHPYQSALIKMEKETIGIFGKLHPTYLSKYKLSDTYYGEIALDKIISANPSKASAPIISKYPAVSRDISLIVKKDVNASSLLKTIKKSGGKLISNVEVFDIYEGKGIDDDYKSISINITYESLDSTLKNEDIIPIHEKILAIIEKEYDAKLRS